MCTAQVLLLNRDAMRRNFGSDVNRRVCRKLFETSDPNPVGPAVFLKKMQEEIRKRDTERWNFDFLTETPLAGRYQWEPVFANKSSSSKKQSTAPESNREERVQQAPVEPIVEEIHKAGPTTQKKKKTGAGASSQHKITDFMTTKKRRNPEECSSSKLKVRRVGRNSLTTTTRLR
ncbi:cyclin-dependent kinase inhibitor 1 [Parasteatoda tepidariorum]|uniref:cyclin-dependent kinase inhibitor 1 n=1 Tax=Parasteatoda tepidariorum TaxID=114398 RepID=UPI000A2BFCDA|nr:cyclin-dependent kinase inhibitor 1 [Parasteatoda tepidariorum]